MKLITRVAATTTAMLSLTGLTMPVANAANVRHYEGGRITVCVRGDADAGVRVDGRYRSIDGGNCRTFAGLERGEVYRVRAFAEERGCRIFDRVRFVRASSYGRTVMFYGRCFDGDRNDWRNGNGNGDGWRNGDGMGRRDGDGNGWRNRGDGQGPPP